MFNLLHNEIGTVADAIEQIRKQAEALEDKKNKVTSIVDGLAAIAEENAASTEETSASMLEFNEILSVCNKATGELRKLSEDWLKIQNILTFKREKDEIKTKNRETFAASLFFCFSIKMTLFYHYFL